MGIHECFAFTLLRLRSVQAARNDGYLRHCEEERRGSLFVLEGVVNGERWFDEITSLCS